MQSSDSFHGFGFTFWTFWIIALHFLYKLWISNILATSITEETCIVEMRIWCKKIGTVNFISASSFDLFGGDQFLFLHQYLEQLILGEIILVCAPIIFTVKYSCTCTQLLIVSISCLSVLHYKSSGTPDSGGQIPKE